MKQSKPDSWTFFFTCCLSYCNPGMNEFVLPTGIRDSNSSVSLTAIGYLILEDTAWSTVSSKALIRGLMSMLSSVGSFESAFFKSSVLNEADMRSRILILTSEDTSGVLASITSCFTKYLNSLSWTVLKSYELRKPLDFNSYGTCSILVWIT